MKAGVPCPKCAIGSLLPVMYDDDVRCISCGYREYQAPPPLSKHEVKVTALKEEVA